MRSLQLARGKMSDAASNSPLDAQFSAPPASRSADEKSNWRAGFWSLIVTQFQNAFNDNAIKFLVIYLVVAMNYPKHQRDLLVLIVGALFALPFIFFSLT